MKTSVTRASRQRRHERIRRTVVGTSERPRLAVYRSNAGIYAQVIDDSAGRTLCAASSLDKGVTPAGEGKSGLAAGVGKLIADKAKGAGIDRVVFDRGGRRFHGRVAAIAEGAREGGLQI